MSIWNTIPIESSAEKDKGYTDGKEHSRLVLPQKVCLNKYIV